MHRRLLLTSLCLICVSALVACGNSSPALSPTPPALADELVLYNWVDYMPQAVLDAFKAEYGVKVIYLTYGSMAEAVETIHAGRMAFDVAVIEHDNVPGLVADGLLAEIDRRNLPNFKNISLNFLDLASDPGNKHYVPYLWGTTGLIVRSDLVDAPITRWADLWNPSYAGRIAARAEPVELLSVALKSLGYPLNSEDPVQLDAALDRLLDLKPSLLFVDATTASAIPPLLNGQAVILVGWAEDALEARAENPAIIYVLPDEGGFLWGDGFVVSALSLRKHTAELFVNFVLRPEISAQIVDAYYYATANEAALPFIDPAIRNDPAIFPPREAIDQAEWFMPLSPEGQERYDAIWGRFLAADQ